MAQATSTKAWSQSESGLVSRALPVNTAMRNCTGDEGGPFRFGNQVLVRALAADLGTSGTIDALFSMPPIAQGTEWGRHGTVSSHNARPSDRLPHRRRQHAGRQ